MAAGGPNAAAHQDDDPLFVDMLNKIGPSVFVRQMARMHEAPKYYKWVTQWLDELDLHGDVLHQADRARRRARASAPPRPPAARCRTGS